MKGGADIGRFEAVVVAEKPGVARAFAAYLAEGRPATVKVAGVPVYVFRRGGGLWAAVGVRGHLMDFDFPPEYNRWRSVDPIELFRLEPVKVVREGMGSYVRALRALATRTSTVILALDADVEGEAIAFEVMEVMRRANPNLRFQRAWFTAVTRDDILNSIRNLRRPNAAWASKAFARMVLDLVIGAAFTRTLTLFVEKRGARLPRGYFLSYGPCQTPVLYLVVKRALEREQFQRRKYYQVVVSAEVGGGVVRLRSERRFERREEAESAAAAVRRSPVGAVVEARFEEKVVEPPEPLATVEMERRASRFLDIRPKRAMDLAENLYQEGLISYPRTDTTIYPPTLDLRAIASKFAAHEELGPYVSSVILAAPTLRVRQGREDDGAHPPIYPLKCVRREEVVKRFGLEGFKLYDLIVRHFLATLSPPMRVEEQSVVLDFAGLRFRAEGLKVLDPGYTLVYPFERPDEKPLPRVREGERARALSVEFVELETKPPPYLSEAELLRLMKRYGIGTDATMQDHIHTNVKRKYFEVVKKRCIPTPLGRALIQALSEVAPELTSPEVRGRMEAMLRGIAEGSSQPEEVVKRVKEEFLEYLLRLRSEEEKVASALLKALEAVHGPGGRAQGSRAASRP